MFLVCSSSYYMLREKDRDAWSESPSISAVKVLALFHYSNAFNIIACLIITLFNNSVFFLRQDLEKRYLKCYPII